jgi:segregation and condensation protein B
VSPEELRNTVEAALLAAGRPLALETLIDLFDAPPFSSGLEGVDAGAGGSGRPSQDQVREALGRLAEEYTGRGIELREVASGFRVQVRPDYTRRLGRLWAERPPRYSRALLETLALVAYRQPISRAEIEEVRGVSVSTSIFKTLQERDWIRVVGHRDTPGRPALYGTTRQFLDDFNLRQLADLPPLAEVQDLDRMTGDLFEALVASAGESREAEEGELGGAAEPSGGAASEEAGRPADGGPAGPTAARTEA